MRISTSMLYKTTSDRMSQLQSELLKTQEQISANRRVLTPADDPIAAARALEVTQKQSLNTQYADNRTAAKNTLNLEEQALQTLTSRIQDLQTSVVEAGNAAYTDDERKYIAAEMRGMLDELLSVANSTDESGNYIFSGFKTSTTAFSLASDGVTYNGDQGQRSMQVSVSRQLKVSDSGDTVFQNSDGVGTFSMSVSGGTFAEDAVSSMNVTNEAAITGETYEVVFAPDTATGDMMYYVYDEGGDKTDPSTAIKSGAYTDPTTISLVDLGVEFTVSGERADDGTDELTITTVKPNSNQSLFTTVSDLINLLETETKDAVGNANLNKGLADASSNLSSALDNVLTVRAYVGTRLNEIENLDSAGLDIGLQYSQILSDLQDLDYTKAISQLAQQKFTLEAAQSSYVQIVGLSLFNYL